MSIEKKAFVPHKSQEERDAEVSKVIPVRLNRDELAALEVAAKILRQPKLSTTLKQLAQLGNIVIHGPQTGLIIETLFKNDSNNKRIGIVEVEPKFKHL